MKQLLLFSLKGKIFAAWKEEIEEIGKIGTVSSLPLDRRGTFDVTIIDDRLTYLYDLSVCLGFTAIERKEKENALILPGGRESAGFTVEGNVKQISVAPEDVLPLPDYLKTDIIDTCVEYGSKPVPVINLSLLHAGLQQPEYKTSTPELRLPGIEKKEGPPGKRFLTFSCCGRIFAVSNERMETAHVQGENISKLPLIPCYVEGIIIRNGRVLPLIRLSDCLGSEERTVPESALVLVEAGQCFGFLVDSVGENLDGKSVQVAPLPPLVASAWMREAILSKQGIMPCIHPFALLEAQQKQAPEQTPSQQYTLDSRFSSLQYNQEIEVVEFTLLGRKHAIPGCETEDTVPYRPFCQVPTQNSIVAGISEHKGMILPVLDLAPPFGKKSAPASGWSMVLFANGDFRAFLLAETVLGKRLLGVELQKELPVHLSEDVVYGCYLDEDAVTLILNTASMAFHAEYMNTKELLSALTTVAAPDAAAQAISSEPRLKAGYADRQATGADDQIVSGAFEKAETKREEISEITESAEKAPASGAVSGLSPDLEEKRNVLKRDETEIPVGGPKAAAASKNEGASQEETGDTEAGSKKMKEAIAAGRLDTEETGQSMQLQAPPSPEDEEAGEEDGDKPRSGKKPIWYAIASVLLICFLVAGYFIFAPADWKPGDKAAIPQSDKPQAPGLAPAIVEGVEAGAVSQGRREETIASYLIYFIPNSSLLLPGEGENLRSTATFIDQNPPSKIVITGHTALVGTEESCLILSKERAEAVRDKLLSLSTFDEGRVITRGAGASEPIADNSTSEGRRKNRRVEIRLVY